MGVSSYFRALNFIRLPMRRYGLYLSCSHYSAIWEKDTKPIKQFYNFPPGFDSMGGNRKGTASNLYLVTQH